MQMPDLNNENVFILLKHGGTGFYFGENGEPTTRKSDAAQYESIAELLEDVRTSPQWDAMSFAPDTLEFVDFTPQVLETLT